MVLCKSMVPNEPLRISVYVLAFHARRSTNPCKHAEITEYNEGNQEQVFAFRPSFLGVNSHYPMLLFGKARGFFVVLATVVKPESIIMSMERTLSLRDSLTSLQDGVKESKTSNSRLIRKLTHLCYQTNKYRKLNKN